MLKDGKLDVSFDEDDDIVSSIEVPSNEGTSLDVNNTDISFDEDDNLELLNNINLDVDFDGMSKRNENDILEFDNMFDEDDEYDGTLVSKNNESEQLETVVSSSNISFDEEDFSAPNDSTTIVLSDEEKQLQIAKQKEALMIENISNSELVQQSCEASTIATRNVLNYVKNIISDNISYLEQAKTNKSLIERVRKKKPDFMTDDMLDEIVMFHLNPIISGEYNAKDLYDRLDFTQDRDGQLIEDSYVRNNTNTLALFIDFISFLSSENKANMNLMASKDKVINARVLYTIKTLLNSSDTANSETLNKYNISSDNSTFFKSIVGKDYGFKYTCGECGETSDSYQPVIKFVYSKQITESNSDGHDSHLIPWYNSTICPKCGVHNLLLKDDIEALKRHLDNEISEGVLDLERTNNKNKDYNLDITIYTPPYKLLKAYITQYSLYDKEPDEKFVVDVNWKEECKNYKFLFDSYKAQGEHETSEKCGENNISKLICTNVFYDDIKRDAYITLLTFFEQTELKILAKPNREKLKIYLEYKNNFKPYAKELAKKLASDFYNSETDELDYYSFKDEFYDYCDSIEHSDELASDYINKLKEYRHLISGMLIQPHGDEDYDYLFDKYLADEDVYELVDTLACDMIISQQATSFMNEYHPMSKTGVSEDTSYTTRRRNLLDVNSSVTDKLPKYLKYFSSKYINIYSHKITEEEFLVYHCPDISVLDSLYRLGNSFIKGDYYEVSKIAHELSEYSSRLEDISSYIYDITHLIEDIPKIDFFEYPRKYDFYFGDSSLSETQVSAVMNKFLKIYRAPVHLVGDTPEDKVVNYLKLTACSKDNNTRKFPEFYSVYLKYLPLIYSLSNLFNNSLEHKLDYLVHRDLLFSLAGTTLDNVYSVLLLNPKISSVRLNTDYIPDIDGNDTNLFDVRDLVFKFDNIRLIVYDSDATLGMIKEDLKLVSGDIEKEFNWSPTIRSEIAKFLGD